MSGGEPTFEKERPAYPVYERPVVRQPDGLQAQIAAMRDAITARNGLLEAISEQIRIASEAHYAILKANQLLIQEEAAKSRELAGERHRIECEQIRLGFEGLGKEVQFIRGYTEAANENVAKIAERLSALESKQSERFELVGKGLHAIADRLEAIEEGQKQMELRLGAYIRGLKSAQSQSNQSVTGKQRRRKKR